MATWKKLITSASNAELNNLKVSQAVSASAFSGSYYGDGSNLTGISSVSPYIINADNGFSASFNPNTQTLRFTSGSNQGFSFSINGTTEKVISINGPQGLKTTDSPTFNNMFVNGDLTVLGNLSEMQITNLNVEDKFILLNSGSNTGDAGFIFQSGSNGQGIAFGWDESVQRFGFQVRTAMSYNSTTINPDSYVASVVDASSGQTDVTLYQKPGNIKIENNEAYIYI